MPKVTVCIPTYNRAEILPYAVNSVLNQTYGDFELIICDDASPDQTSEVVAQWQDPRLRYIRHPQNIQRSRNMRSGYEAATGDYFVKFDDDDALTPEFLAQTVAVLDQHPEVDFVCTDHWVINARNQRDEAATQANSAKWGKDRLTHSVIPDLVTETFEHQSLQVGSTLFRRSSLEAVDFMRFEADGCEDFDLLVRLALAGQVGYFIPERLMEYRFHGGQTSLRQDIHFLSAKLFCLEDYRFDRPELEQSRRSKIQGLKQVLALRLIEKGEDQRGRQLLTELWQSGHNSRRAQIGRLLSRLPLALRRWVFQGFRQVRAKDYSERVRGEG
ncbi:glycosyltransferase family 2 protein [Leptolyngbya sp. PCC 6406]|uniref:glycosyltransferase family 2 protein n=1 Tax=Leptolyngbya sp. PCC 6406 TaxID=1173264 RepID=UPI0002AD0FFD|nr:glycosyltransferase [Leptolyngbya sp. PCC 6406]